MGLIGVLAVHLHQLIIKKTFYLIPDNNTRQDRKIDSFRICISAYGLSRYSKTVRMHRTEKQENIARFDQTMQMMIRIYDSRHDQRHLIHIILYGYLTEEKRYALIADQIVDSIQLVSVRYLYIYIYIFGKLIVARLIQLKRLLYEIILVFSVSKLFHFYEQIHINSTYSQMG
ncbi:unnamed protein product [Rotaria magnacalcarata]